MEIEGYQVLSTRNALPIPHKDDPRKIDFPEFWKRQEEKILYDHVIKFYLLNQLLLPYCMNEDQWPIDDIKTVIIEWYWWIGNKFILLRQILGAIDSDFSSRLWSGIRKLPLHVFWSVLTGREPVIMEKVYPTKIQLNKSLTFDKTLYKTCLKFTVSGHTRCMYSSHRHDMRAFEIDITQ